MGSALSFGAVWLWASLGPMTLPWEMHIPCLSPGVGTGLLEVPNVPFMSGLVCRAGVSIYAVRGSPPLHSPCSPQQEDGSLWAAGAGCKAALCSQQPPCYLPDLPARQPSVAAHSHPTHPCGLLATHSPASLLQVNRPVLANMEATEKQRGVNKLPRDVPGLEEPATFWILFSYSSSHEQNKNLESIPSSWSSVPQFL